MPETRKVGMILTDYDFRALSPIDFEHLTRDVLNADLKLSLQGYAPGPDQGIDLRQVAANGAVTVVQCKHYLDSSWSTFMRAVRKEADRGQGLGASSYLFVTSRALSPHQQDELVQALRPMGVTHDHVWGREKLNEALLRHPDVERRNIKLWLSSAGMLDTLLNAGRWQRSEVTLDEVRDLAKLWVRTPAYDEVLSVLEREGVCIVYGPPGAGKTFLAEMVLLAAAAEGWKAVHVVGDIEDAWKALTLDDTNQIFYYNDFLGEGQLQVASKNEPTQLANFIKRVRKTREHKRFILATREQNLLQAADEYDALQDLPRNASLLGIRMDRYPVHIRAEILFNHLYFSDISEEDRLRLAIDNRIVSIVDHSAYNPRLIEASLKYATPGSADEKLEAIKHALDHPDQLWEKSFRKLPPLGQQILLALATLPARPWPLSVIRELVATSNNLSWRPTLRILESTWVNISGQPSDRYVAFANPSCRDYLLGVLDDAAVAEDQVDRIRSLDQVVSLTRSAGLTANVSNRGQRPELAHSLSSRRDRIVELIRSRVDANFDGERFTGSMDVLRDAAAMLAVYGAESDTGWLLERISSRIGSFGQLSSIDLSNVFMLAELLQGLTTGSSDARDALSGELVANAIGAIKTSRGLDAYEALPQYLRSPDVEEAARQRAREVLTEEADYLLYDVEDSDSIRFGAGDIERRALWYRVHVNIGPLLDRANEMQIKEGRTVPWPDSEADAGAGDSADDAASIRQIFSRFGQ
jgi:hypothetical protein